MKKTTLALLLSAILSSTTLAEETQSQPNIVNITINNVGDDSGLEMGTGSRARGIGSIATGKNSVALGKNAVATGGNETKDSINAKLAENKQKLDDIATAEANTNRLLSELQNIRKLEADVIEAGERVKQVRLAKQSAYDVWQEKLKTYNDTVASSTQLFKDAQAKIDDLNSRLTGVSRIGNVDISSDEGLTNAATQLKSIAEEGTTLNLSVDFYKDYVSSYYRALGDLRHNQVIINNTYSPSSSAFVYSSLYNSGQSVVINPYSFYVSFLNNIQVGTYRDTMGSDGGTDKVIYKNIFAVDTSITIPTDNIYFKNIETDLSTHDEFEKARSLLPKYKTAFKLYFEHTNNPFATSKLKKSIIDRINAKLDVWGKAYEVTYYQSQYEDTHQTIWLDKKQQALNEYHQLVAEFNALPNPTSINASVINEWKAENIDAIVQRNNITTTTLTSELEKALGINKNAIAEKQAEIARLKTAADQAKSTYDNTNPSTADIALSQRYEEVMRQLTAKANQLKSEQDRLQALKDALTLHDLTNVGENAYAIGTNALATGTNSLAIGTDTIVTGENSIAMGKGSVVTGTNSIAIGTGHNVLGNNSGAFGDPDYIYGDGSYAFGNNNTIGDPNKVHQIGNNTFVLGSNIVTTANNAVILGANSTDGGDNTVSVGSSTAQRKIVYIANGAINQTSKDAINGSQLYDILQNATDINVANWQAKLTGDTLNSALSNVSAKLKVIAGTNTTVTTSTDGDTTTYAVNVSDQLIKNVMQSDMNIKANTDASNINTEKFAEKLGTGTVSENDTNLVTGKTVYLALQNAVLNGVDVANKANKDASNLSDEDKSKWQEALGTGTAEAGNKGLISGDTLNTALSEKANKSEVIQKLGSKADKDASNIDVAKYTEKLTTGRIELGNTGLINGGQVHNYVQNYVADISGRTLAQANAYTDYRIGSLKAYTDKRLKDIRDEARAGVASAMAMGAIPMVPNKRFSIGAGTATYHGQNAVAIGLKVKTENDKAVISLSGSASSNGDFGASAGFAFGF